MCTFAHVLVMMFVLSLQSYQKGLTPQTGARPIFYFSRLACACIHVHARDEVLADNNNCFLSIDVLSLLAVGLFFRLMSPILLKIQSLHLGLLSLRSVLLSIQILLIR